MQLKGKVAFVTGGSSGIGKAAAALLAKEGAKVAILARDEAETEAAARAIAHDSEDVLALTGDVSSPEGVQRAVEKVAEKWNRIDIVFANAGINGVWASLDDLTPEEWDRTLDVNLKGTFLTVKYSLPYLKKRGGAVIITSSVNGTRMFSNTGATAYSCSKAAQVAFAKMAALELARDKIRVNVICPGAIESEIAENTELRDLEHIRIPVEFPEGRIPLSNDKPGKAEDVAKLVLFLASDASHHISGTEIWIDGTQSLLQG